MNGNLKIHSFYKDILCTIPEPNNVIEIKENLKLFPNPTKDMLLLETESKITIYNAQGLLLQETAGKQIDLSAYPAGIYLLKVNDEMYKLIKQ